MVVMTRVTGGKTPIKKTTTKKSFFFLLGLVGEFEQPQAGA